MLERPGPAKDSLLRVWALPAPRAPGPSSAWPPPLGGCGGGAGAWAAAGDVLRGERAGRRACVRDGLETRSRLPCSGPGGAQGERGKESTRITWHKTNQRREVLHEGVWQPADYRTAGRGHLAATVGQTGETAPVPLSLDALETTNPGHPYSSALLSLRKFLREQPAQAATQEGLTAVGGAGSRSSCGPLAGLAASVCGSRSAARPLASSSLLCSCLS